MGHELHIRWEIESLSSIESCFYVKDNLAKKSRFYYVPYLDTVKIVGSVAYVYTNNSKVMSLNLFTNSRYFISNDALERLGVLSVA